VGIPVALRRGVVSPLRRTVPSADFPVAATVTRDNVFLGSLLVASQSSNTLGGPLGWTYYHADHLGTPRLVTGAEGPILLKYWPFGDEVSGNQPTSQRLKFATMERDAEANYYYDHARTVDFNLGRFVSGEPVWLGGTRLPETWNSYRYADNNPSRLIDPDGKNPLIAVGVGLIAAGGIVNGVEEAISYAHENPNATAWQILEHGVRVSLADPSVYSPLSSR